MSAAGKTLEREGEGPTGPLIRLFLQIKQILDWSGRLIAAASLLALFVVLLINVILRYFFGSGIAWAYEIHGLLLPWLVAGGLLMAASHGRNIAVTLLPEMLGVRWQRSIMIAVHLCALVISVSVVVSSTPILRAAQYQTFSTIPISQIWGYFSLIYAFGGMAVIAAIDAITLVLGRTTSDIELGNSSLS
jgi:TRAP-type C4-dicarboxylate transport system permease small subunit